MAKTKPAPKTKVKKVIGRPVIYTKDKIEELAKDLIQWSNLDDSLVLREWCCNHNRGDDLFYELREKEKLYKISTFSRAVNYARTKIGSRREKLAGAEGGLDAGIIRSTLANYDREHFNNIKEMKAAGEKQQQEPVIVKVVNYSDSKIKSKSSGED